MRRTWWVLFGVIIISGAAFACTEFQVKAKDDSVIIGRSMEFAIDLKSEVVVFPRGLSYTSENEKGIKGISWTSKYGFLAVDAFGEQEAIMDGMNEAGLSIGFLWFPGSQYQEAEPGKFIAVSDMAKWVLGNFATVDEVRQAVKKVKVISVYIEELNQAPGLHCAVHDAQGNNIVIEFIDGEMILLRGEDPWQVSTNFIISTKKPKGADSSCRRYNQAYQDLQDAEGSLSSEAAMTILESVAQPSTIWSITYNRSNREILVAVGKQYDKVHRFELEIADREERISDP